MSLGRDDALAALKKVVEPSSGQNIVAAGLLRALTVDGSSVRFVLDVSPSQAKAMESVRADAEAAVRRLPGVEKVAAIMTAHSTAAPPPPDLKSHLRSEPKGPAKIPGVDRIIAVASGKGGVGKSTVAANLAVALAAEGQRTGLLDGDVYGPSQPRMLGVSGRPASPDGKTILPMRNHGVTMMSMGLLTAEDEAVVWRGPMLMGALQQMMNQVQWGALDMLLVDLPPGTGDVQMTLCQHAEVSGAIIVCTPQDVALIDTRKGIDMFRKMDVPIIGMIENMSKHVCSKCGHVEHVFDHGGVAEEARKIDVPLLAEIPLQLSIRQASDSGQPIVISQPNSPAAAAFRRIARGLVDGGAA
ncbi:MAG: Mrp/NBP35 family ATP-binding protein [Albidovulum sp.]|nr:Mrp/NBP35 family ATP-binding protein [Albidovulum sp.]